MQRQIPITSTGRDKIRVALQLILVDNQAREILHHQIPERTTQGKYNSANRWRDQSKADHASSSYSRGSKTLSTPAKRTPFRIITFLTNPFIVILKKVKCQFMPNPKLSVRGSP